MALIAVRKTSTHSDTIINLEQDALYLVLITLIKPAKLFQFQFLYRSLSQCATLSSLYMLIVIWKCILCLNLEKNHVCIESQVFSHLLCTVTNMKKTMDNNYFRCFQFKQICCKNWKKKIVKNSLILEGIFTLVPYSKKCTKKLSPTFQSKLKKLKVDISCTFFWEWDKC